MKKIKQKTREEAKKKVKNRPKEIKPILIFEESSSVPRRMWDEITDILKNKITWKN